MEKKFIKVVVTITVIISLIAVSFSLYVLIHRLRNNTPSEETAQSSQIIRYLDYDAPYYSNYI